MTTVNKQAAFESNQYRNVFAEYGYSEEAINERVQSTWDALFGEDEATKIYYELGHDKGYLLDTGNNDVRSEGMSYGMMMAVQYDRQDIFDRLWNWTYSFMYMTEGLHQGYFAWSCQPDGHRNAQGPAPDGEEFFAMALFFASHRWGDREAPYNYSQQARNILHTCLHQQQPGYTMWNLENKLIKFVPEVEFSDPSYHLPHFYELFALWANEEDRVFWKEAAQASRDYIHISSHPVTGLAAEYAFYDGTPNHIRGFGHFFSDSYRVAANIGLDYLWYGVDERQVDIANRIQAFFADKSPDDYRRYSIDGEAFEEKSLHPVGLLATNAVASIAASGEHAKSAVELLWNTPVRTGDRRYYDNCIYIFAILALSGNYRIWKK
ncbi:MAG: glycosyl hydrolase family 8 [Candidatus Pristimantibacillus lignocellulolyticus]|uniref:Glycosyl hydrolase family 8 n=1 Tax=Candidatus Pristimantibacillus lignocellulolyticus TaxID=2994561 RepID=A0A9J6ZGX7_9BACL|nr:MAG: glycosyl hydrolase family 8 [Candidatus Pristimantibacillus lignocellulolyticus]